MGVTYKLKGCFMRLAALLLLSILSLYAPADAVLPDECSSLQALPAPLRVVYVDADDPACGLAGSTTQPLCALQPALDAAIPGDAIRIRRTAIPYKGPFRMRNRSGTVANPIVIENDPGTPLPVFTHGGTPISGVNAVLYLEDVDHAVVRLLVFDGFNQPGLNAAIHVHTKTRNTTNVDIRRNTVRNWIGEADQAAITGQAILLSRAYPRIASNQKVQCNKLQNNASEAMRIGGTIDTFVGWNEITGQRCGLVYDAARVTLHGESIGIKVSNSSAGGATTDMRTIVRGNLFSGFDPLCEEAQALGVPADAQGAIWCDVGAAGGLAEDNIITGVLGNSAHGPQWGIHIESRCDNWTVRNNTVVSPNTFAFTAPYRARNTNNTTFTDNLSCGGERHYWVLDNSGKSVNINGNTAYGGVRPLNATNAIINGTNITGYSTSQLTALYQQTNAWDANLSLCPTP